MNWKIKKIKVSELKENPCNPRRLTEKGLKDLEKSILKFGIAEPLVVNTDYMICGGHGRKKILEKLNIKEVDCYLPDKLLSKKQFDELGIRLNKNIAGEFNFDILANEFEIDELIEWGFEEFELGVGIDADFPELASGDGSGFQQMTFTLSDSQVETVKQALTEAKKEKIKDSDNENSNGNALYKICCGFVNGN